MAKTVKVNSDGSAQPMGDTRGLVTAAGMAMPTYGLGSVVPGSYATNANFSWTATETGYILVLLSGSGGANARIIAQINASSIDRVISPTGAANILNGAYAIEKGDVFTFINEFSTPSNLLWFMKPKIVQAIPPVIAGRGALVSGGAFQFDEDGQGYTENYSEQETQVGWYTRADGKKRPVYKRAFTGNIVAAANTGTSVTLIASGVAQLMSYGGQWERGNGTYSFPVDYYGPGNWEVPSSTNVNSSVLSLTVGTGEVTFGSKSNVERAGTSSNAYQVWVSYTKIADAWV
jgi:hypothetical protein